MEIRKATKEDVSIITEIEAQCFPKAEAATYEEFAERLAVYPEGFWLLFKNNQLIGFIDGMVTNEDAISDKMFVQATLHVPTGKYQSVFGLNVLPLYRKNGYGAKLMEALIADARAKGRKGCILTCKKELIHYYSKFGYENLGKSASVHGGAIWYDMILRF